MASSVLNKAKIEFFKIKTANNTTITIPNSVVEGTDTITLSSKWSTANVQGGTQSLVAYESVDNPNVPIQLRFNQDLCNEFNLNYVNIVNNLAKIQYPVEVSNKIKQPYCKIEWDGRAYRGYFTNVRITLSGPYINGNHYRSNCEVSAQFIVSPKTMLKNSTVTVIGNMTT